MRISKKIAAIILAVVMTFAMMPISAFAIEGTGENGSGFQPGPDIFGSSDVAMIGDTGYETLSDAISAATSGDVIKMVDDTSLTSSMNVNTSFTLDLNGHTITSTATLFNCYGNYQLTIKDTDTNGAIDVNAGKAIYMSSGKLTLESGAISVHSTSSYTYGVQVGSSGTFEMNGGSITIPASSTSTYNYCVNNGGTTIINGGELVAQASGSNYAISSNSNVTITGGSVTAYAYPAGFKSPYTLYFTSGTANVSGGYFKAYGDSATYSAGYLIDGNATTSVTGGYFGGNYYYGLSASKIASGYTTVTLTNDEADPTDAAAKTAGYKHKVVKAVAKIGSTYYATLEAAIEAARTGSAKTVTLIDDVDLTSYPAKGQHRIDITNVTIDLNQHTFTASGRWGVLFEGTNATIKNGTMEAIDNSDATGYQYGVYVWGGDGSDGMPDPAQKASVTLENLTVNYGIHTYNAEVTVKDCNVTGSSKYYAIWADCESTVNVESGNFTTGGAAVLGTAQYQHTLFGHINVKGGNFTVPTGKKLIQNGSSCETSNTKFKGGTIKYANGTVFEVLDENLAPNCTQNMETGEVTQNAPNNQASLEVADTIVEDIYVDEDFYGDGATVKLTYNENSDVSKEANFVTETYEMSELPAVDGGRLISVPQAPAQATEPVTVQIYKASQSVPETTINTNAYSYCRAILEDSTQPAELKEVAESTLDYAAAAQLNFGYNTGDLANKDAPAGNDGYYNDVNNADLSGVAGFSALPNTVRNATLVIKSDLEINLLANYDIKVNSASLDTNRGGSRFAATATGMNGDFGVINIKGIEPANMNNTITVNTDSGKIEFTANTVLKVMSNSKNAKLATLAKAAYLYGTASENYFA